MTTSGHEKQLQDTTKETRGREKELSPSVAAMFDSIEAAASGDSKLKVPSSEMPAKEGLSPTLKAMLKMEEAQPTETEGPGGRQGEENAIQKLMNHPRGPLLPHPGLASYQQPMQSTYPPPPQLRHPRQQYFHAPTPRGERNRN